MEIHGNFVEISMKCQLQSIWSISNFIKIIQNPIKIQIRFKWKSIGNPVEIQLKFKVNTNWKPLVYKFNFQRNTSWNLNDIQIGNPLAIK